MRHLRLILLFITILPFTGCAFIHSFDKDLPQQVDIWMKNKEYNKVIKTLAYIHPDNPQYAKLAPIRELAMQKALQYETDILNRGKKLLSEKHWQQAYQLYQQGLEKLPDSPAIHEAMRDFIAQRDDYIKQLSYQILINRSQTLLANAPLQKKIHNTNPDNYAYRVQVKRYNAEKDDITSELLDCTEYNLKINKLLTSQKCLQLASRLNDKPASKRQQELESQLIKQQQVQSQQLSDKARINLTAAEDALKHNRLRESLEYLKKVPVEDQKKPAVKKFQAQLDQRIQQVVKQGNIRASKLYSAGKIKQALEIWRALLVLDPGNPALKNHIKRAQRVLKKLESLGSKKPAVEN